MSALLVSSAGGALLWAGPAGADGAQGAGSSAATSPASPTTALGGYTLTATGSGMSIYYEQPNLPVPATPSLEADAGYSTAAFDSGPIGTANASTLWPGAVVAGGGSELSLLVGPYLDEYCGSSCSNVTVPDVGNWPIDATTAYPQGPDTDTNDTGPSTMEANSNDAASTATASLSSTGGSGTSELSSAMVNAQSVGSTAQGTISNAGDAVAEATSTVQGISIAGLIDVGQVTSTATSSSDGTQGTVQGSSAVTGATVAGQAVTVNSSGVQAAGQANQNPLGALTPTVSQILQTAGMTMTLTNPTDTVNGPAAQRQLDGLQVTINLSTYDKNFASLVAMMPSQLKSAIFELPAPLPDEQIVTIDFGWVNVNANASPAFSFAPSPGSSDSSSSFGAPGTDTTTPGGATPSSFSEEPSTTAGGLSDTPITDSTGIGGGTGLGGDTGGSGNGTGNGDGTPGGASLASTTAPVQLFKGIGAGLIALGLLLGAILAFFLIRTEAAAGALGTGPPCVGEDRRPGA